MRADPGQRLLISRQHAEKTPALRCKNDTCGASLQRVCAEIAVGARRNRDERSKTEGDFLRQTDVKVAESEIIELGIAEAGTWPTCSRRVCDERRNDVHDLLHAGDFERNNSLRHSVL